MANEIIKVEAKRRIPQPEKAVQDHVDFLQVFIGKTVKVVIKKEMIKKMKGE